LSSKSSPSQTFLHRRQGLESLRHLLLPWQSRLTKDLSSWFQILSFVKEDSADYDLVTHHSLMMIYVGGAVWTIVTVYWLALSGVSKNPLPIEDDKKVKQ